MTPLLLAALLVTSADPDPVVKLPTGSAPMLTVLRVKDKMLVREQALKYVEFVEKKVKEKVGDKEVEKTVYETVEKVKMATNTYPIKGATFQTADGKKLETEEALKKLGTPTLVVMSSDGKSVDEGFLAALKPGMMVVVIPMFPGKVIEGGPVIDGKTIEFAPVIPGKPIEGKKIEDKGKKIEG